MTNISRDATLVSRGFSRLKRRDCRLEIQDSILTRALKRISREASPSREVKRESEKRRKSISRYYFQNNINQHKFRSKIKTDRRTPNGLHESSWHRSKWNDDLAESTRTTLTCPWYLAWSTVHPWDWVDIRCTIGLIPVHLRVPRFLMHCTPDTTRTSTDHNGHGYLPEWSLEGLRQAWEEKKRVSYIAACKLANTFNWKWIKLFDVVLWKRSIEI